MSSTIIVISKPGNSNPAQCSCFIFDNDYKSDLYRDKHVQIISSNVRNRDIYINHTDLSLSKITKQLRDHGFNLDLSFECGKLSKCDDLHNMFTWYTRHFDSKHGRFYTESGYDFQGAELFNLGNDTVPICKEQEIPF